MAKILILSDVTTWDGIGMSRYAGPYVIATGLRKAGYQVEVIDWITRCPNLLELIEKRLTRDTIGVCLSTTFLTPDPLDSMSPEEKKATLDQKGRSAINVVYRGSPLWFLSPEECAGWFHQLRDLLDRTTDNCKVILGGARVGHFYTFKEDRLAEWFPKVDYALAGSADDSVLGLFEDIRHGRVPYGNLRGGIRFITPIFNRNICPEIEYRPEDRIQPGETLPIEIKRGCAFNCKFCHYEKRGSTLKNSDLLRDEFTRNYERFGTTLYTFSDDCFNDNRPNVEAVCNTILGLPFKVEWISYARADLAIKFPDTLKTMVEAGARGLFFGIETFNHEAGRAAGKGVPPEKVKQFLLDTMANYGDKMVIQCSFIAGLPHETDQSMAETIDWLDQNRPMHLFSMVPLGLYEYHEDLDETAIDYADYVKNPAKYGFEEVRHKPDVYWRHASMDLPRAQYWAQTGMARWFAKSRPLFRSIWRYPVYRSLGLSHEEIITGLLDPNGWERNAQVRELSRGFFTRYWNQFEDQG